MHLSEVRSESTQKLKSEDTHCWRSSGVVDGPEFKRSSYSSHAFLYSSSTRSVHLFCCSVGNAWNNRRVISARAFTCCVLGRSCRRTVLFSSFCILVLLASSLAQRLYAVGLCGFLASQPTSWATKTDRDPPAALTDLRCFLP
jgi:hypothetical protein